MTGRGNALLRAYVPANVRRRDPMSFVEEASKVVAHKVMIPNGYFIQWSGQFENQVRARARLQILVPLSMFVGFILIFMAFKSIPQTMFILFAGMALQLLLAVSGFNTCLVITLVLLSGWGFIFIFGIADDNSILITTLSMACSVKGR